MWSNFDYWWIWGLCIVAGSALAIWWLASPSTGIAPDLKGRVRYVVDGDSLYIDGHKPQIRLWGVDAPEKSESGFEAAKKALAGFFHGRHISCQLMDTDKYGRTVARCFLSDGREINRMMIESGTASEYMRFSKGFYRN